jgi:hypothetical protein
MGTQASAYHFSFCSWPGFYRRMRFVQYYFGLPLAMVVLCITFVPIFSSLKVFTPYEFLEHVLTVKQEHSLLLYSCSQEGFQQVSVFMHLL